MSSLGKCDEGVDSCPRDPHTGAGKRCGENRYQRRRIKRAGLKLLGREGWHCVFFGHEQVIHLEIRATGATQAGDAPIIDDLDCGSRENHKANIGRAIQVATRRVPFMNDRIPNRPMAVLDEAAVAPTPGDLIAPADCDGLSGRVDAASKAAAIAEDFPSRRLRRDTRRAELNTEATIEHQPTEPSARDNSSMTFANSVNVSSGPPMELQRHRRKKPAAVIGSTNSVGSVR